MNIVKTIFMSLLIITLTGYNSTSVAKESYRYEISGGLNNDPTANGSTVAILGSNIYYIQTDIIFKANRKDGYSSLPLVVKIAVQTCLLYKSENKYPWSEVADSCKVMDVNIIIYPEKGISASIIPCTSFFSHAVQPGYTQQLTITPLKILWDDKPKDGWIYGTVTLVFNYGPGIIYAGDDSAKVTWAVQSHEYFVNIRKRL